MFFLSAFFPIKKCLWAKLALHLLQWMLQQMPDTFEGFTTSRATATATATITNILILIILILVIISSCHCHYHHHHHHHHYYSYIKYMVPRCVASIIVSGSSESLLLQYQAHKMEVWSLCSMCSFGCNNSIHDSLTKCQRQERYQILNIGFGYCYCCWRLLFNRQVLLTWNSTRNTHILVHSSAIILCHFVPFTSVGEALVPRIYVKSSTIFLAGTVSLTFVLSVLCCLWLTTIATLVANLSIGIHTSCKCNNT